MDTQETCNNLLTLNTLRLGVGWATPGFGPKREVRNTPPHHVAAGWLVGGGWLVGWLGWLTRLVGWCVVAGSWVGWLGWLAGLAELVGDGWLVGWLVRFAGLVDWLAG